MEVRLPSAISRMPYSHYPAMKVRLPSGIDIAACGWKVLTSPRRRRVDPEAPALGPLLTGSSLLAALFKAWEDDERHQESHQDQPN
ncbi:hypothetical protein Tco_1372437 [Tanacetum coccineum]